MQVVLSGQPANDASGAILLPAVTDRVGSNSILGCSFNDDEEGLDPFADTQSSGQWVNREMITDET